MGHTILITGASGYLGSAISVDLARDNRVIGVFRRSPSEKQRFAAPDAQWEKGDIADDACIRLIFSRLASEGRRIDFILHFAAFTDYGEEWQDEYCDTNVIGTRNILKIAEEYGGVKRVVFASSIAALRPPSPGGVLTETSPACDDIAYARSKAIGEKLLAAYSGNQPAVILRIGGVFTDWCELPPLFSLMTAWGKPGILGRLMPGSGKTGFPFIHRRDIVKIVRRIIERNDRLDRLETLFAAFDGYTGHDELFPAIKQRNGRPTPRPIGVSPALAKLVLKSKYFCNTLMRKPTYERSWMVNYVDRPLAVDTSYTRKVLDWSPTPDLHVLKRMPVLMHHFRSHYEIWRQRNLRRNEKRYRYEPDDGDRVAIQHHT